MKISSSGHELKWTQTVALELAISSDQINLNISALILQFYFILIYF